MQRCIDPAVGGGQLVRFCLLHSGEDLRARLDTLRVLVGNHIFVVRRTGLDHFLSGHAGGQGRDCALIELGSIRAGALLISSIDSRLLYVALLCR